MTRKRRSPSSDPRTPLPVRPVNLLAGIAPGVDLDADDLPAGVAGAEATMPATVSPPTGVHVLSGYGLRVAVERGHLVVDDGVGADRRRQVFSRIDGELKRLVILGHAGTISLDAIRWLHGVGAPIVHLDTDGTLFFVAAPPGTAAPAQRRAQLGAMDTPLGVDLKLEVREVSAGEGEKLRALFAKGTPDKWTPEERRSVFAPGFRLFE